MSAAVAVRSNLPPLAAISLLVLLGLIAGFSIGKNLGGDTATRKNTVAGASGRALPQSSVPALTPASDQVRDQAAALIPLLDADPLEFLAAFEAIGDPQLRIDIFLELVGQLSADQFPRLLDATVRQSERAEEIFDEDFLFVAAVAIDRWTALDQLAPLAYFAEWCASESDDNLFSLESEIFSGIGVALAIRNNPTLSIDAVRAAFGEEGLEAIEEFASIGLMMRSVTDGLRLVREGEGDEIDADIFETIGTGNEPPQLVIAEIMKFEDADLRDEFLHAYLPVLSMRDPGAAIGILDELDPDIISQDLEYEVIAASASSDPLRALFEVPRIDDESVRTELAIEIINAWRESDPQAAIEYALNAPDESLRLRLLSKGPAFGGEDTLRLLDSLSASALEEFFTYSPGNAVESIKHDAPQAGLDWLADHPEVLTVDPWFIGVLGSGLTWVDPAEAIARLDLIAPGESRDEYFKAVASSLAVCDPENFKSWLGSLAESERAKAAADAIWFWAASDPQSAASFAIEPGTDPDLLRAAIATWSKNDPGSAFTWLAGNAAPDTLHQLAENSGLIASWTEHDPVASSRLLLTFPPATQLEDLPTLIEHWSSVDPVAASEFLTQLPEGELRDRGTAELVLNIYRDDAKSAAAWIETIRSEELRRELEFKIEP